MKNLLILVSLLFSINLYADGHVKPAEGAFTTLNVSANDVEK